MNKLELLKEIMNLKGDYKLDNDWVIRNVLNINSNELRSEKIRRIWKKVFPSGHAAKVLETIKILNMVKINPV